jgi:hypothetical protein
VVYNQVLAFGFLVEAPLLADSTEDGISILHRRRRPQATWNSKLVIVATPLNRDRSRGACVSRRAQGPPSVHRPVR